MKKTSFPLLAAAALLAATSFSHAARADDTTLTGFYVGGFGDYGFDRVEATGASADDFRGWEGGAFVGYRLDRILSHVNNLGIGMNGAIEGFYGWANGDGSNDGGTVEAKRERDWGVSFRPGFSVIDQYTSKWGFNPYAILGYRNTEYGATVGGAEDTNHYNGFELGIGTEVVAYQNIGFRVEYSHTFYGDQDGINPEADDIKVGIAYHF